ncbi:MAG: ABC transporter ATP-binding protein/permease [Verrucomicrobiales bacterium]|nr:ABC transporter ATP-binding protein/permease [Verrucomicrobiales bacterium]
MSISGSPYPKQSRIQLLRDFPRVLALTWHAAKKWTVAWVFLIVLEGLLPAVSVYLTRAIVNGLTDLGDNTLPQQALLSLSTPLALLLAVLIFMQILHGLSRWIRLGQSERVSDYIQNKIHSQANRLDLEVFERPEFYDQIYRASSQSVSRSIGMLESLGGMLRGSITLAAMMLILIPYAWWLPLALLTSTLPALLLMVRHTRKEHRWWLESTVLERKSDYYDWLMTSGSAAAEIRVFGLGDFLKKSYRAIRQTLRHRKNQLELSHSLASIASSLLALLIFGLSLLYMIYRVSEQSFRLGDLALLYQAFYQGQSVARSLMSDLGSVYQNGMFLRNLFDYLALEPKIKTPDSAQDVPERIANGIELKNINFQYPGADQLALEDLSIKIPANKITVIIGANGSGKSTLIKLIARLFDPQSGQILIDGQNLKDFNPDIWRENLSALFQEPLEFQDTVLANISLGRKNTPPDLDRVRQALEAVGLASKIDQLPKGIHSHLGKWFDEGTELSGGEWRRIALARAIYRDSPLILLDEPNSSMDAIAEADWLQKFHQFSKNRTTIIISHRLAIARQADHLIVLDQGHLAEQGHHQDLIKNKGIYAQLYHSQATSFGD